MDDNPWASSGLEVIRSRDLPNGRLNRPGAYVVCFGAYWCGFTRRFMPQFAARKGTIPASFAIADITDREDPLWDTFRIRITPTVIVFRDGEVVLRVDGRRFFGISQAAMDTVERSLSVSPSAVP